MLLIVTVGLVVVALALLVLGFVQDSLAYIYLSILCSAVAAVVLTLFTRVSRRRAIRVAAAGADDRDLFEQPTWSAAEQPTSAAPAGTAPEQPEAAGTPTAVDQPAVDERATAEPVKPPEAPTRQVEVVHAPSEQGQAGAAPAPPPPAPPTAARKEGTTAEAWDGDWDDEDVVFPIEDYDNLRVPDILPLLGELDVDELEEVRAREVTGKARGTLVKRIDTLLASFGPPPETMAGGRVVPDGGVEAGPMSHAVTSDYSDERAAASEAAWGVPMASVEDQPPAVGPPPAPPRAAPSPPPPPPPVPPPPAATPPAGAAPPPAAAPTPMAAHQPTAPGGGAPEGGALPIADYDQLRVSELLPLLAELDPAELRAVEAHEQAGLRRRTILVRISRLAQGSARSPGADQP